MKSEKIKYKGKFYWVNSEDLDDTFVKKLFVYKDENLRNILRTSKGYIIMVHKKDLQDELKEGYGTGFSMSSFRGGMAGLGKGAFGGASNLGGPNMMYTYEIKPLNHTLEQKPTVDVNTRAPSIQLGSKISGFQIRSNATPDNKKVKGIIHQIAQTDDGAIKFYVIFDEATTQLVKIDPLTAKLLINEPVEYYYNDMVDNLPSRRKEKLKNNIKENKIVRESLNEESIKLPIYWQNLLNEKTEEDSLENSKSIPKEMKEKIAKYGPGNYKLSKKGKGGIVTGLRKPKVKGKNWKGVGLGADKTGFFAYTHRAASKRYESPEKIPQSVIDWIETTG